MTAHLAMSVIVCWGIHSRRIVKSLLLCLGIHTLIDLSAGIQLLTGTLLSQTAVYIIIYAILIAVAAVSLLILKYIHTEWQKEVSYEQ